MDGDQRHSRERSVEGTLQQLSDVRGTVALVTGGASGLGTAMASVLVECGAHVVVAAPGPMSSAMLTAGREAPGRRQNP